MEQYTGLIKYISEYISGETVSDDLGLGCFSLKCNARIMIKLKLGKTSIENATHDHEAGTEVLKLEMTTYDADDTDFIDPYYTHTYITTYKDINEIMSEFNEQWYILLDILHTKLIACRHCGQIFGINNTEYEQYGFIELCLCNSCGLQSIYDTKYSEDRCCICLDAIGYGEFLTVCGDTKHKLHIGCGNQQHICPLCRRGGIEIVTEP